MKPPPSWTGTEEQYQQYLRDRSECDALWYRLAWARAELAKAKSPEERGNARLLRELALRRYRQYAREIAGLPQEDEPHEGSEKAAWRGRLQH